MQLSAPTLIATLGLALATWPPLGVAQRERDFVFSDDQAHLVLRFAGVGPGGLSADQTDEIVNVELSTMVHDRLRADARFEAEPVDSKWARPMRARLDERLSHAIPNISATKIECRSASCRLVLEHSGGHTVAEDQSLMGVVERAVRAFIQADPASFERVFLMAAHYKESEQPYIKVFLHRAEGPQKAARRSGS
jgi:hypothetical protein